MKPASLVVLALLGWRRPSLTVCVLPPQALQAAASSGISFAQAASPSPGTVPHSWGLAHSSLWLFATGPGWLSWLPWDHQGSAGRDAALSSPRKQHRPSSLPALNSAQLLCLAMGLLGMHSAWLTDLPSVPSRALVLALRSAFVWGKEGVSWLYSALPTALTCDLPTLPQAGLGAAGPCPPHDTLPPLAGAVFATREGPRSTL